MSILQSEISVRVTHEQWTIPEAITQSSYRPPHGMAGWRVIATNHSSKRIDWLTVDVGIPHNWQTTEPTPKENGFGHSGITYKKATGVQTLPVRISGAIPPDGVGRGQFSDQRPPGISHSSAFLILRVYGVADGQSFVHHIAHGFIPPITVTEKHSLCFIANSAFHDSEHPVVRDLRFVRDEILERSASGRRFIAFYYRHSPRVAAAMDGRPALRAGARCILTPIALTVRTSRRAARAWTATKKHLNSLVL